MSLAMQMDGMTRPLGHNHYHFLNPSVSANLSSHISGHHFGTMYDLGMETPREIALLRMSRQTGPSTKPPGHGNGGISESIAMHQRKLRDTEARIDHAMDLVTRSFGVNQNTGLTRHTLPRSPEVSRIRETLIKTQRVPSVEPIKEIRKGKGHFQNSPLSRRHMSPMFIQKRKKSSSSARQVKSGQSGKPRPVSTPTLRIYKTKPVITAYVPPKKGLSKDKIDRNATLFMNVVTGNTHVYANVTKQNGNSKFVNTFANMKSLNTVNDSNPTGLEQKAHFVLRDYNKPIFRTKIDMGGFADNEISFQCEGQRVIITGNRSKKIYSNSRKVTEVVELPSGVYPEKLRIARDPEGVLHLEERWH